MSRCDKGQDGGLITACVHTIDVGYTDDPHIYAAPYLLEWERSEAGKYVMKNSIDVPYWTSAMDARGFGCEVKVIAKFTPEKYTYFKLKYA